MKTLSIVVITRNRLSKLKRCLASVQSILPEAEIIIVDNASTDGTTTFLHSHPECTTIYETSNTGVAAARNIGMARAQGQYIMLIDDDAWIASLDWPAIEAYFQSHPSVGIIAPRLTYPDGREQESVRSFPTILALVWRGTYMYKIWPQAPWYTRYIKAAPSEIAVVDWAIGACQIIRRSVFATVGPLDQGYFFGYEDADFCRRAKAHGYETVYWPHAQILHEYARTSSRGFNLSLIRHLRSIVRFFMKHV